MTILIKNQQKLRRLNTQKIKKTARKVLSLLEQKSTELSILFVDDKEMKRLNTAFRGIRKTTDVLSFPQFRAQERKSARAEVTSGLSSLLTPELVLGDIVINIEKTASQAKGYNADFYDEIYRLLVHGILHLLGYSHEKTRYKTDIMRKKEKELLNAFQEMG